MLDAVLAYARLGWAVFPLIPGGKRPAVPSWKTAATTNETTIRQWWSHRPYNIGIACGPSNLLVVDCDEKGDGGGLAAWYQLGSTYSDPISTYTVLTASRPFPGEHWYFAVTDGLRLKNSTSELAPRVDIKCGWGFVVAPPSIVDGAAYEVDLRGPLAPAPGWLLELVRKPVRRPATETPSKSARHPTRYGRAALEAELDLVAGTQEPGRRNATRDAALRLGSLIAGGELPADGIEPQLVAAAMSTGLSETEATRTVRDGLRDGMRSPRKRP